MVDNDVYYLLLALMNPSQKPGFKGGGWYRCCFSSPFDRFSFAPAASTFTQLKTIVRPGRVIICKQFLSREQGTGGDAEVRGFPPFAKYAKDGHPASFIHGDLRRPPL